MSESEVIVPLVLAGLPANGLAAPAGLGCAEFERRGLIAAETAAEVPSLRASRRLILSVTRHLVG